MKIITFQGSKDIASALSEKLGMKLVAVEEANDLPNSDVVIVGEFAHERFPDAICKIFMESSSSRDGRSIKVTPSMIFWKDPSSSDELYRWVEHYIGRKSLTISLIIPVYNRQEHLRLCLEALSKQSISRSEYEIIVVDDGSEDNSAAIGIEFGVKTITTKNKGPAAARNIGIEAAHGDILVFLDADILVSKDYLKMVRERHCRSNALLLLGARRHLPAGISDPSSVPSSLDSREKLLRRYSFCLNHLNSPWSLAYTCNFSITKNFLQKIRFDEEYVGWGIEDIDFAYELYKKGANIVFSKAICGYHLYHDRTFTLQRYQNWLVNLQRFLQKHPEKYAQKFVLFKDVFNPEIKANYFDVFDKFENRTTSNNHFEIWDLTKINEEPLEWIQRRLTEVTCDIIILADTSDAILDAYLPFFRSKKIISFIPKEDWTVVEPEFNLRYKQNDLCKNKK